MATGTLTTYDLTVGVMLDIEPAIALLDPFDTPLLGLYGADGRSSLSKGTAYEKKVEWLDDTLLTPRDALNGSIAASAASITVDDALKFGVGDVIRIDDEFMRVTGSDNSTVLQVDTGYAGSTETTHADNAVVVGVGTALPEGSDPGTARARDRSARHNVMQIFGPHQVVVSGTENVVRKYGLEGTTEFQYQVAQRMKETAISIEQSILYGTRYEDTSNKWRTMGGLDYFITTNEDSSTTTITEATLLAQAQAVFDAGGRVDRAVMGSKQKRVVSAFNTNITINVERSEATRGQTVEYFVSDFGTISLLLNRWCRVSDLFLYSRDQVELTTLRPFLFEPLAKTGDSVKAQILAEKSLKLRREKHAAKFSALT